MHTQVLTDISFVPPVSDTSLGTLLVQNGKLDPSRIQEILLLQQKRQLRFGEAAMALGMIEEGDVKAALAKQFRFPYLDPGQGRFSPELQAAYRPYDPAIVELRKVRSQLALRWFDQGHPALVIASVGASKPSLTVANLGVLFAQLGRRTLIVDANLRQPRQHEMFNVAPKVGLSDLIADRGVEHGIVFIKEFANLSLLAAGTLPPNPDDLVCRPALKALNERLGEKFDVILYDVPPPAVWPDAYSIAAVTGGMALLAAPHKTRRQELLDAAGMAAAHGAIIVGSVLLEG